MPNNNNSIRTLVLPGLYGQANILKNQILPLFKENLVDSIVSTGDLFELSEEATDRNGLLFFMHNLHTEHNNDWVQLIGPNEMFILNSPENFKHKKIPVYVRTNYLDNEKWKIAYSLNGRLVTHGGLTYGEWLKLDRPQTSEEAAERLNLKYMGTLFQGECYKLGNFINYAANPIWADPIKELYPSWLTTNESCPFDQIHASNSLNNLTVKAAMKDVENPYYFTERIGFRKYGSKAVIRDSVFTGLENSLHHEKELKRLPDHESFYLEKKRIS